MESLICQSRRPHSHPKQHAAEELKLIWDMCRCNPDLGMVELWHRLQWWGYTRRLESLFRVMRKPGLFPHAEKRPVYKAKPYEQMIHPGQRVQVEFIQTDNGFEFTNRLSNSKRDLPTLFEVTAAKLGIHPYTPRHNGKVECSHQEDEKRFYSCHRFYSLNDFSKQLAVHNRRSNNFPMRHLGWLSSLVEFTVQYI